MNIRNETDVAELVAKGFDYVTVDTYSDDKAAVRSKHRTRAAAEKAARNTNRTIVEVTDNTWWQF